MKKAIIVGSLLATGLLFARGSNQTKTDSLSYFERQALETQSPRVHVKGMDKHKSAKADREVTKDARAGYSTVSDKTSVNAYIPVGK